jgi:hypothetical protein
VSRKGDRIAGSEVLQPLADKASHPYISGGGGVAAAINQFRKNFPATVTADTLKKLSIAPYNESYLINILRFIGAIDDDGNRTAAAQSVFSKHKDEEFHKAFEGLIKSAYKELFALHGEEAWKLDEDALISFFRNNDATSAVVGKRQAGTFEVLASFAGHGELPAPTTAKPKAGKTADKPAKPKGKPAPADHGTTSTQQPSGNADGKNNPPVGLTVRIEVNLPAAADQDTYDRIFRSIRENLLNAK